MSFDDWKKSAELTNQLGAQAAKHGLQYAYHNHNVEFKKFGGTTAWEMLIAGTDPQQVKFEMDCGWVAAAGYDPAQFLAEVSGPDPDAAYQGVSSGAWEFEFSGTEGTESRQRLGMGSRITRPIFEAAKNAQVEQYYIEQEPPYVHMTALEAVRAGYEYLHGMS